KSHPPRAVGPNTGGDEIWRSPAATWRSRVRRPAPPERTRAPAPPPSVDEKTAGDIASRSRALQSDRMHGVGIAPTFQRERRMKSILIFCWKHIDMKRNYRFPTGHPLSVREKFACPTCVRTHTCLQQTLLTR